MEESGRVLVWGTITIYCWRDWGKPWNPSIWTCDNRDLPSKEHVYNPLNEADRSKSAWNNELRVVQQVTNHEDAKGTKPGVIIREGSISWLASTEWLKPETSKQFAKLISSQYLLPPPPHQNSVTSPSDIGISFEHPWKELVILYKDAAR